MINLILCGLAGYFIAGFLGREEGHQGWFTLTRIRIKEYVLHLHHWLYASFILVALPSTAAHKGLIEAFLVGVILQGLQYKDFYKVVYRDPRQKQ